MYVFEFNKKNIFEEYLLIFVREYQDHPNHICRL